MAERREHRGAATPATLLTTLGSNSPTSFVIDQAVGWPDGSVGPFFVVIDRDTPMEEKVLVTSRSANSLVVGQRGADDTLAQGHDAGAPVEHCLSAIELDEANAHIMATSGVHGTGDSTVASSAEVDADVDYHAALTTGVHGLDALDGRVDAAESAVTSLDGRLDTLEGQTLDARLDLLEGQTLDARLDVLEQSGLLVGEVKMWTTMTPPTRWLACEGAAVSRSTYAALFAVIGTQFGSGDGSTTFNLPNFQGRTVYGQNSGIGRPIGYTGGASSVTLTEAQMPSHTHTGPSHTHSTPDHTHGITEGGSHTHDYSWRENATGFGTSGAIAAPSNTGSIVTKQSANAEGVHAHGGATQSGGASTTGSGGTGSTGSTGSGSSVDIVNPHQRVLFIIYAGV